MTIYEVWGVVLQFMIVGDLVINLFFHVIQLRKYCCQQDALLNLSYRFNGVESKLNNVDHRTRRMDESLSQREGEESDTPQTQGEKIN